MKKRMALSFVLVLSLLLLLSFEKAECLDPEAISQLSKAIAEENLVNVDESQPETEASIYVSSSLGNIVENRHREGAAVVSGLAAFSDDDFIRYINTPTKGWYPVNTVGAPGGWGAKPLPGEKIYVNRGDPVAWTFSWRNITPIPTYRSTIDPVYRGESSVSISLFHIQWGSGNPTKIIGQGGHPLSSYPTAASTLKFDRVVCHSQGCSALYNLWGEGGFRSIEPFQGKIILGAGHSPLDVGKNQIATGRYWSSFPGDVITRGAPLSLGSPFGNPLKIEAEVLRGRPTNLGASADLSNIMRGYNIGNISQTTLSNWSNWNLSQGFRLSTINNISSTNLGSWNNWGLSQTNFNIPQTNWSTPSTGWNFKK